MSLHEGVQNLVVGNVAVHGGMIQNRVVRDLIVRHNQDEGIGMSIYSINSTGWLVVRRDIGNWASYIYMERGTIITRGKWMYSGCTNVSCF